LEDRPCQRAATALIGLVYCSLKSLHLLSFVAEGLQGCLVAYVAGLCALDEHPTAVAMAQKLGISRAVSRDSPSSWSKTAWMEKDPR